MPVATDNGNGADVAAARKGAEELIALELAVALDFLARSFPQYEDPVHDDLNSNAYHIIRTTDVTAYPARKLGTLLSSWQLDVVGEGEKAEAVQAILRRIPHMPSLMRSLVWALAEGIRFGWMTAFLDESEGDTQGMVIPRITVYRKVKAGGVLEWDGERVIRQSRWAITGTEPQEELEPAEVDRSRLIIFKPDVGANPEGDTTLGWLLYLLAEEAQEQRKNRRRYGDRHGLPHELIRRNLEKARPTEIKAQLKASAAALENMPRQGLALDLKSLIEILEPTGKTWEFLGSWGDGLAKVAHQLWLMNSLTSDTADTGPTGSSKVHQSEEQLALASIAHDIGEAFTTDLLPFVLEWNADRLPSSGSVERIILVPPPVEVTPLITDVHSAMNLGHEFDSEWYYGLFGTVPPEGTPATIGRTAPLFDFGGLGGFGGGGDGDDEDDPPVPGAGGDDDDDEGDDDPGEEGKALRNARTLIELRKAATENEADEVNKQIKAAVKLLATIIDASLPDVIEGGEISSEFEDLLEGLMARSHVTGAAALLAEIERFLELEKRYRQLGQHGVLLRRDPDDQAELDKLAQQYRLNAIDAKLAATDNLRKAIHAKVAQFIEAGGSQGDTEAFVKWLKAQQPDLTTGYAKLILRNGLSKAYSLGRLEKFREVGALLGLNRQVFTAGDASVRPEHKVYHGVVIPAGAQFDDKLPPFDHNCRCTWVVTDAEPASDEVLAALPVLPFNQ